MVSRKKDSRLVAAAADPEVTILHGLCGDWTRAVETVVRWCGARGVWLGR